MAQLTSMGQKTPNNHPDPYWTLKRPLKRPLNGPFSGPINKPINRPLNKLTESADFGFIPLF